MCRDCWRRVPPALRNRVIEAEQRVKRYGEGWRPQWDAAVRAAMVAASEAEGAA